MGVQVDRCAAIRARHRGGGPHPPGWGVACVDGGSGRPMGLQGRPMGLSASGEPQRRGLSQPLGDTPNQTLQRGGSCLRNSDGLTSSSSANIGWSSSSRIRADARVQQLGAGCRAMTAGEFSPTGRWAVRGRRSPAHRRAGGSCALRGSIRRRSRSGNAPVLFDGPQIRLHMDPPGRCTARQKSWPLPTADR